MKAKLAYYISIFSTLVCACLFTNCSRKPSAEQASETQASPEVKPVAITTTITPTASPKPALPKKVAEITDPIDVNAAALEELMLLPRIGAVTAQKIVERRPYSEATDLLKVSGIGEKTLAGIEPFVTIGPYTGPAPAAAPSEPQLVSETQASLTAPESSQPVTSPQPKPKPQAVTETPSPQVASTSPESGPESESK